MDQSICKLTLVYPPEVADAIIELVLNVKPAIGGFTTLEAKGHGFDFSKATTAERVRGRVARGMLIAVMPRTSVDAVLSAICADLPVAHLGYWVEPVSEFGRLVDNSSPILAEGNGGEG